MTVRSAARSRRAALRGLAVALALAGAAQLRARPARADSFDLWLEGFRAQARAQGVRDATLDAAFAGLRPLPRVIELDRRQAERRMAFATYRKRIVSLDRVRRGRELMARHGGLLAETSARYGVPADVIVALWGVETSYGANTGGFSVIAALATLAHDGRRAELFQRELLSALRILDAGVVAPAGMTGSWAGAMGQSQFMPSTYLGYAVDADRDGRADIWASLPDVFASIANYLAQAGWQPGWLWGRPVRLPPSGLAAEEFGLERRRPLAEWRKRGVRRADGDPLPVAAIDASLLRPDAGGEAFLVYDNFRAIMVWNRSTYFALSVGLLADRLRHA